MCSDAGLTVRRRRRGKCEAQIGRFHTRHCLWCRYIQRDIWAVSLSARLLEPSWQRRPKPGASIHSIPSSLGIPCLFCPGLRTIYLLCTCNFSAKKKNKKIKEKERKEKKREEKKNTWIAVFFFFLKCSIFFLFCFILRSPAMRSDAGLRRRFLRLNRKAPLQRIRSAKAQDYKCRTDRDRRTERVSDFYHEKEQSPKLHSMLFHLLYFF